MSVHEESTEDSLKGVVLGGRYKVERLLGEGGMGRVYIAKHEAIGKKFAVKVLNAEMTEHAHVVERFKREARAATAVGSEHIIDVSDMGELDSGAPYIVMELLKGIELGELIEQQGPMRIGRAVRILMQTCDALEAAHEAGIVHRDLKPENIFLVKKRGNPDFVKVLDFGISKFTEHAQGANHKLTQTGMTMGTPSYMSPEQAQGMATMDHRTDVYALGVILHEMLTGEVPFLADSFALLLVKILTEPPPKIRDRRPDVPPGLEAVMQRCLAKEVDERFPDCAALRAMLDPYSDLNDEPFVLTGLAERMTARPPRRAGPDAVTEQVPKPGSVPASGIVAETGPLESFPPDVTPPTVGADELAGLAPTDPAPPEESGPLPTPTAAKKSTGMIAAGVVLGLIGIGAAGWAMTRTPEEEGEATVVDAGVAEPEPPATEVRLRIVAAPRDARITIDGREYPNPLDAPRPRSLEPVRLRIEREGYETHEELLVLDHDREIVRALDPATAEPTAMVDEPPVAPTTRRRGRRRGSMTETTMDGASAAGAMQADTSMGSATTMTTSDTMDTAMTNMGGFRDDF